MNQRFILIFYACTELNLYLRDIIQAYVQSKTFFNRQFYIRLSVELRLKKNAIFRIFKFLYGILEAGNHWFNIYHIHHVKKLLMTQSTYDSCLLFTLIQENGFGIVGMLTNDIFIFSNETLRKKKKFDCAKQILRRKKIKN